MRRRGYIRPQGTAFADSARNRDSVMSLGSIAHMQYYFARTGLLDGKGAQLDRGDKMRKLKLRKGREMGGLLAEENREGEERKPSGGELHFSGLSLEDTNSSYAVSDSGIDYLESPTEIPGDDVWDPIDPTMLPPTVSTYKMKPEYTEPLPDLPVLRRELKGALQDACKVLEESQKPPASSDNQDPADNSAYHEIQGLHLLDIITLAIRAAKNYYTAHTNPEKLYALRSERVLRKDLYNTLDTLKRMAGRNFKGGIRLTELTEIIIWIESIDKLLKKEDAQEEAEQVERAAMVWREGDWSGREREREWLFLKSFDSDKPGLPPWTEPGDSAPLPSEFLSALQDGQRLVKLHNACVARSKKKFDEIRTWHTDVAKAYRMADNLRYWAKAAELRWEIRLDIPALDIVHGKDEATWRKFDGAIFKWCQSVREELTEEWRDEAQMQERRNQRPPELKVSAVEVTEEDVEAVAQEDVDVLKVNIKQMKILNDNIQTEQTQSGAEEAGRSKSAIVVEDDKENAAPLG